MGLLTRDEYKHYLKNSNSKDCLFCKYKSEQEYIFETNYWVWIYCKAPYWKWHTMFIPKRHIINYDQLSVEELVDLTKLKQVAENKYKKAELRWDDGEPVTMYFYFWREREGGFDQTLKLFKQDHFHLHMVPERDGSMEPILDPDATNFDLSILKKKV